MTAAVPKTAYEIILEWSAGRPLWQQDALRRIVERGKLSQDDVVQLAGLCLKGRGAQGIALEAVPLAAAHLPQGAGAGAAVSIVSIAGVTGVNRLAPDQVLPFAPAGLTVVYGDNGVGKSGYARILKRMCRARFVGDLLPNQFDAPHAAPAGATVAYMAGAAAVDPIVWINDGKPHPVLSAVSVFDRECATVHVRGENEVAFRPLGLDIPDELAATCQAVREVLTTQQSQLRNRQDGIFSQPTWSPMSPVGRVMGALTAKTDLAQMEAFGALTLAEDGRLTRLNDDLARDTVKAAAEEQLLAKSMRQLADGLGDRLIKPHPYSE
ncbi:hypothetical protein [Ancylobacter sp.]|uniref:hypothetical protein n=1 Tax=Ancylobacter sp. TaxID=1872567 RepID=UPI003D10612D